jgi:hypothetical protein
MKKNVCKKICTLMAVVAMVAAIAAPASASVVPPKLKGTNKPSTAHSFYCSTSEEFYAQILLMYEQRVVNFEITIPNDLPEANMTADHPEAFKKLMSNIKSRDTGFVRFARKSSMVWHTVYSGKTTFVFINTYDTTLEKDNLARDYAKKIVAGMKLDGLNDFDKMDKLRDYMSANFTYDYSGMSTNAYDTIAAGKGTCSGLAMYLMLLLKEAGLEYQAINGTLSGTGHLWLIVRLNGYWYAVETTNYVKTYLENAYGGSNHIPDSEFLTSEFKAAHPLAPVSYKTVMEIGGPVAKLYRAGTMPVDFMPDTSKASTREEAVAIVVNVLNKHGKATDESVTAKDIDDSKYAAQLRKALGAGIITVDIKGNVNPTRLITQEEFAVMLVRAYSLTHKIVWLDNGKTVAPKEVSEWAKTGVAQAQANGLISIDSGFKGRGTVLREQLIVSAYKMSVLITD